MFAKLHIAFTIIALLLFISIAIVGINLVLSIGTESEAAGVDFRSGLAQRVSMATVIKDTYDVFILIIKPIFVIVVICLFSPYMNDLVSQFIPLWILELLHGSVAESNVGSIGNESTGTEGLLTAVTRLTADDSIPSLEPNPNDHRKASTAAADTDYVIDEVYGRIPRSVFDKWKEDESQTTLTHNSTPSGGKHGSISKKNRTNKPPVPVRTFKLNK